MNLASSLKDCQPEPLLRPRRIFVIHNPVSGRRRRRLFAEVVMILHAHGCDISLHETAAAGEAGLLAARALRRGCDRLVVAGGDGTINEVINGLAALSGLDGLAALPPLGLIPLGTANVLAHELGLRCRPEALAAAILEGPVHAVSLGRVCQGSAAGRLFHLMAGAGFDAHVVDGVDGRLKAAVGKAAYVCSALACFLRFPRSRFSVRVDGQPFHASSVVVANAGHYGGPYVIAPRAGLARDSFEVVLLQDRGARDVIAHGVALQLGRFGEGRRVRIVTGSEVRIEGEAGEPLQADGDLVARLPVDIAIVPRALRLAWPAPRRGPGLSGAAPRGAT
jgi:diacylglycerol kinase (ATP)